jgi:ElaB/YqjD/DUF883 family membrane-anchored ribosome-binding protein
MATTESETGNEGLVGQATSQVQDAAATAQEKAVELKEQGRSQLSETLDERTNQAGAAVRQLAEALRQSGEQLRSREEGQQIAGMAEGAAGRVERLGDYLSNARGDDVLRDVEDFARQRPWLVAGMGLIVGLAASRFLKASSERRFEASGLESGYSRYPYGTSSSSQFADEELSRQGYATSG